MNITIDTEFKRLIPALLPEEFKQLEDNILHDGCLEPLSVWKSEGKNILLDGHNRYTICEKHGQKFETQFVDVADRDHAKLWILTHQLGRRNINDDQRAVLVSEKIDLISKIEGRIQRTEAGKKGGRPKGAKSLSVEESRGKTGEDETAVQKTPRKSNKTKPRGKDQKPRELKERTRKAVAKKENLPEKKVRQAHEIKRDAPELTEKVQSGAITLLGAKKLAALSSAARPAAIKAVEAGKDVRSAIREAKKEDYNQKLEVAKPKPLEGTYRIICADPPWKYVGLNKADEYGHAERHYDCLDDEQLCAFEVGGRPVSKITDDNAVLFLWVTSPLLERSFAIMKAWGFSYKSSFVWDKVAHNMGFYNSVRHEFLLIGTKGQCTPDIPELVDSVQSIERSKKHSEKPQEFFDIIEGMYNYGRKLVIFSRKQRDGWDVYGNEV